MGNGEGTGLAGAIKRCCHDGNVMKSEKKNKNKSMSVRVVDIIISGWLYNMGSLHAANMVLYFQYSIFILLKSPRSDSYALRIGLSQTVTEL